MNTARDPIFCPGYTLGDGYGRNWATTDDLETVDRALHLVRGNRHAAAAVLGIDEKRLRNLIAYHVELFHWRKDAPGRPRAIELVKALILDLPEPERHELMEWWMKEDHGVTRE
jgi:hypothetical protein